MMKVFFSVVFLFWGLVASAQSAQYDVAPEFPGGNKGLEKYLTKTLKYPETARKQNTEGKVLVGFLVDENGKVTKVNVIRGVHPLLDNEAMRVIKQMPKWKPATKDKKNTVAPVALPITFELAEPVKK